MESPTKELVIYLPTTIIVGCHLIPALADKTHTLCVLSFSMVSYYLKCTSYFLESGTFYRRFSDYLDCGMTNSLLLNTCLDLRSILKFTRGTLMSQL